MPSKSQKYDVIIIGQGLAGSLLAWELIRHHKKVLIIDNFQEQASSKVAAGIINPITGHRLNLTENFGIYMNAASHFYQSISDFFKQDFLIPITQNRLIKNAGQYTFLLTRLDQEAYSNFLEHDQLSTNLFKHAPFGVAKIQQSYRVRIQNLLARLTDYFQNKDCLLKKKVDYQSIQAESHGIKVENFIANNLVFCEGFQAIYNPWLKALPFKLAKGEILTITTEPAAQQMLNWGNWLLPVEDELAYLGASYAWEDISTATNSDVADQLLASLQNNTDISGKLLKHAAGIRPTTHNRQFFIGQLKELQHAYCFNGFGSKGSLTIPYFANVLSEHLSSGEKLRSLSPKLSNLPEQLICH